MAVVVSGYYETVRSTMSYNCFVAPYMKLARNYFSNESSHIFTYTSKTYIHTIFCFFLGVSTILLAHHFQTQRVNLMKLVRARL